MGAAPVDVGKRDDGCSVRQFSKSLRVYTNRINSNKGHGARAVVHPVN